MSDSGLRSDAVNNKATPNIAGQFKNRLAGPIAATIAGVTSVKRNAAIGFAWVFFRPVEVAGFTAED